MSHYRRIIIAGGTYFFTVVTYRRRRILCEENVKRSLRDANINIKTRYPFQIDGWVLLPDHLHCIWTLPPGDANFPLRWQRIKRAVTLVCGSSLHRTEWMTDSKRKHRESTLWQRRYYEHTIRDEDDFQTRLNYLHFNPVKHGFSKSVSDWPYSSFHRYVKNGVYPDNWGGRGIENLLIDEPF